MRAQAAVYLLGMVAMNLPHGGFEHVDNLRRRALAVQGRYVALFAGGYALLAVAHLGLGFHRAGDRRPWLADAGETLLLIGYFAVVPVVLAVGLYFPLWYSARQVARTVAVDADPPGGGAGLLAVLEADDPRVAALGAWGVLVAGAVVIALLAAALWWLSPMPLGGAAPLVGLVAFWSVLVSIIALPHVVVGSWLDRDRGIWYVP